jgi:2-oxoglutarate dehydrogenase E1 component
VERFLTLCAEDNMTVAMPTTPGNYFHLLRWQCLSGRHKPLIVFTPKSMLRLKAAASAVTDFTTGSFRALVGSEQDSDAAVRRVVLCSGKVYYDLAARRRALLANSGNATDTAIVRVERLYPLPVSELCAELARYPEAESVTWVQEEPANMGAWPTMALKLPRALNRPVGVISLPASSAPAGGSAKLHATTHREIIETAIPQGS